MTVRLADEFPSTSGNSGQDPATGLPSAHSDRSHRSLAKPTTLQAPAVRRTSRLNGLEWAIEAFGHLGICSDCCPEGIPQDLHCSELQTAFVASMGAEELAPDSLPVAQHMLNDLHLNNMENQGANTDKAASAKTHKEHANELKDFIKKRIDLFDQYKSREDAQVHVLSVMSSTKTLHEAVSMTVSCEEWLVLTLKNRRSI